MKYVVLFVVVPVLWLLGALFNGLSYSSYQTRIGIESDYALAKPLAVLGVVIDPLQKSRRSPETRVPGRICLTYPRVLKKDVGKSGHVSYRRHPEDLDFGKIDIQDWPREAFLTTVAGDLNDIQCSAESGDFDYPMNPFTFGHYIVYSQRVILDWKVINDLKDAETFSKYFLPEGADGPDNFVGLINKRYPNSAPFEAEYRIEENVFAFQLRGSRPARVSAEWWLAVFLVLITIPAFAVAWGNAQNTTKSSSQDERKDG